MTKPTAPPKSKPTLKSIANALQMSVSGVSIALRNDPSIPKKTCQRVQAEAERQGYRRNPLVSAFCANRRPRNTSGLTTLAYLWHGAPKNPKSTLWKFYKGATETAYQLNYQIEIFDPISDKLTLGRLDEILYTRGIRGVLVAPPFPSNAEVDLQWSRYASVSIGNDLGKPMIHNVALDYFATLIEVFHELNRMGFQRPGLVLDKAFDQRMNYLLSSAYLSYTQHLVAPGTAAIFYKDTAELTPQSVSNWIRNAKVDVVMGHKTELMSQLQAIGIKIPQEVSFVTLQGNHADAGIASIQRDSYQIGRIASEMLITELQRNQLGIPDFPKNVRIIGKLTHSDSLLAPGIV